MLKFDETVLTKETLQIYITDIGKLGYHVKENQELVDSLTITIKAHENAELFFLSTDGEMVISNGLRDAFAKLWDQPLDRALERMTKLMEKHGVPIANGTIPDEVVRLFCRDAPDIEIIALCGRFKLSQEMAESN